MSADIPAWQKFIADAIAKDPDKFKKAVLWQPDRGYWKREAMKQVYADMAIQALIKGEQK